MFESYVSANDRPLSRFAAGLLWIFGVVLPAATLGIELTTRICTDTLFDPIPTPLHVLLVALVPLANGFALVALRQDAPARLRGARAWRALTFANGVALGVAVYYALVFLPLVPISVIAILYGLGLLSLAPLFATFSGMRLWRALRKRRPAPTRAALWGLASGAAALLVVAVPPAVTRYALSRAVEGRPAERARYVTLLRTLGSREALLRACYERTGQLGDLASFLLDARSVSPQSAREVYYRVTGEPFNSVPAPRLRSLDGERLDDNWDVDQGGAAVGGVLRGLSLTASRLDGSLDADAALGYLEWTFELRNDAPVAREGRVVVALPPGGVVTRATLWINGEEREAAFGGRAAVRAAYESVVRVSRDPLLVTTAGPDRVLVQCFPVPAEGVMKVRLGITAPLLLEEIHRARLPLPHLVERNFAVAPELRHALWVETEDAAMELLNSLEPPSVARLPPTPPAPPPPPAPLGTLRPVLANMRSGAVATVQAAIGDPELASHAVRVYRAADAMSSWTVDPVDAAFDVVQTLELSEHAPVGETVVVVDGSRGLADEAGALRRVLAELPGPRVTVILAGDEPVEVAPDGLLRRRFRGGTDNVPALVQALDRAARSPFGFVVWVHAPQPVALGRVDELLQRCERRPDGPKLVALAATPGPNKILESLDGCPFVVAAARRGPLAADLSRLLREGLVDDAGGAADGAALVRRLERVPAGSARADAQATSMHLARLWARRESDRLALDRKSADAARDLAVRYALVTPRSGAVVLETAQQYEAAGLTPGVAGEVPTIPEPSTIALMLVVAVLLAGAAWRRRRERWRAVVS